MVHIRDVIGYMVRHAQITRRKSDARSRFPRTSTSRRSISVSRYRPPRSSAKSCSFRPRCRDVPSGQDADDAHHLALVIDEYGGNRRHRVDGGHVEQIVAI